MNIIAENIVLLCLINLYHSSIMAYVHSIQPCVTAYVYSSWLCEHIAVAYRVTVNTEVRPSWQTYTAEA